MAGNQVTGDGLSMNLAGISKNKLYDIMSQMKTLIEQNQDQARQILIQNPLLTKALFQAPQRHSFAFAAESSSRESRGPQVTGASKQEDCETVHKFKALPLNKKIFLSKGDLGVFRSSKRETTVAMAFNFQTEKRAQQAPPVDLFNKES